MSLAAETDALPNRAASANRNPSISIIVPCWRDDAILPETAARWMRSGVALEIIVASAAGEGGGGTIVHPPDDADESTGLRVVHCAMPGRGSQMNAGARLAHGDILLFHHVDTELTNAHLRSLDAAMADGRVTGGAFRRQFDERHPHLRWLEPLEALRCSAFGPLFGDQSIFVRRAVFEALGGFAEIPLMEDVEFTCRLRRKRCVVVIGPSIRSSPRKHLQQGSWRTTAINTAFLLLFAVGVSPARLHAWYYRHK